MFTLASFNGEKKTHVSIYKHLFECEIVIAGKDDHCVVHGVLLLLLDRVGRFDCDDLYLKEKRKTGLYLQIKAPHKLCLPSRASFH